MHERHTVWLAEWLRVRCLVVWGQVAEFMQHDLVEPMRELEKPLPSSDMHEVVQHW